MGCESLPRTISILRTDTEGNQEEAAVDTAASVRGTGSHQGTPVAIILDQTALPYEERYLRTSDWHRVVDAIKRLEVRGAPAIGIAGAIAMMLRSAELEEAAPDGDLSAYAEAMRVASQEVIDARPTAVNLEWAVRRIVEKLHARISGRGADAACAAQLTDFLYDEAERMIAADEAANRRIGEYGSTLLPDKATVLTHCNAGSLATAFYGTALGVIYAANEKGGIKRVYADETRPVGQGSRLTVWELARAGVPTTLICDDMAASVMSQGLIDAVIVGADRVAANGDVANKIGTLGVAIIAKNYGVPFYVACPTSTIDAATLSGRDIRIEERDASEVLPMPIDGVDVLNPAFDVTPAEYITAIITEAGIYAPKDVTEAPGR